MIQYDRGSNERSDYLESHGWKWEIKQAKKPVKLPFDLIKPTIKVFHTPL